MPTTIHKPSNRDTLEELAKKLTPAQRQRVLGFNEAMMVGRDTVAELSSLEELDDWIASRANEVGANVVRLVAERAAS